MSTLYYWIFIVLAHWDNSPQVDMPAPPLWHINLIQSQPVFALTPYYYMLSGEAAKTNFIVFGLTRPGLKSTIYHIRGKHANHYITDVVYSD